MDASVLIYFAEKDRALVERIRDTLTSSAMVAQLVCDEREGDRLYAAHETSG